MYLVKSFRMISILLIVLVVAITVGGCAAPTPAPTVVPEPTATAPPPPAPTPTPVPELPSAACPTEGGTLVWAVGMPIQKLDPLTTSWMTEGTQSLYYQLVSKDPESGSWQPGLAESWEASEDGLTWTFHLRKDVTFTDGTPFNAEAVEFYIEHAKLPTFGLGWFYANVESVEVVDDYTAVFHLSAPSPNLLHSLSTIYGGILSPSAYEELGENYGIDGVVAAGPFAFESWGGGDILKAVRRDDFAWAPEWAWNPGPPCLDSIEFRFIPDAAARVAALEAGEVHVSNAVPPADVPRLLKDPDIEVRMVPGWLPKFVQFVIVNPPLDDITVREALQHSYDRDALILSVWQGYADPLYSFVPSHMPGYLEGTEDVTAHDPELAAELFAEAGYSMGSDGILEKDGEDLRLEIVTTTESEFRRFAEALQAQLRQVGVDAYISTFEKPARDDYVREGNGHLLMDYYGWDHIEILQFFFDSTNIPFPNQTRVDDPYVDETLAAAGSAPSEEEMFRLTDEVQQYLTDMHLWMPVASPYEIWGMRHEVRGLYPTPYHGGSLYAWMGGIYIEQ